MAQTRIRNTLVSALAGTVLLGAVASPAMADNNKVPPGNPCGGGPGQGTGNPCGGNNGNAGQQGNSGNGGNNAPAPPFTPIGLPPATDKGVFISQIGDTNRARVVQGTATSYARIVQNGQSNSADLEQGRLGTHYATVAQDGDDNAMEANQDGTGRTVLLLAQQGNSNTASVRQSEFGTAYSAAAIQQTGNGNAITLVQDGSDNQARLVQEGDDNQMNAIQLGSANRLEWNQLGSGLSGAQIMQTGNGNLQITQSNTGAQFAPPPGSGG